jgi:MFS family permease
MLHKHGSALTGAQFRRHQIWLLSRLAVGSAMLGAISVPLLTPLIHGWGWRALFAIGELALLLALGLQPVLSWQRFLLCVEADTIVIEELVGIRPIRRELPRASARVTVERTLWPLPLLTLTIEQGGATYRYSHLTRRGMGGEPARRAVRGVRRGMREL